MGTTSDQHSYVPVKQNDDAKEDINIEVHSDNSDSSVNNQSKDASLPSSSFSDLTLKLSSALLYGVCSFLITVTNKIVLTSYGFPSSNLLGLGQIVAILIILQTASQFHVVTVRKISVMNKKMWILATLYLGNLITGLGGTKHLPIPMFVALRRISIALTAIGEFYLLRVKQSPSVIMTIVAMIGGSFIAAASDLAFSAIGYTLAMLSNIFTAANVVFIKKTINSLEFNKHEILYYSSLLSIIPMTLICGYTNNLETLLKFEHWSSIGFIIYFILSSVMGYLLMFSTVLCTQYNSPLTTTIVGTIKNVLTTYAGIYIGGDYQYTTMNFIGINISLVGSLVYSYLTFIHKSTKKEVIKS